MGVVVLCCCCITITVEAGLGGFPKGWIHSWRTLYWSDECPLVLQFPLSLRDEAVWGDNVLK